jgi:hypothetical protein
MEHGLHGEADFIFIINGPSDIDEYLPKESSNIRIIRRDNTCYDLGAVGEVLRANNRELFHKYKRFIFLNASIRGPFLPTWAKGCWSDMYLNRLSDEVKLVGMTYDCQPHCFVQSMIIATDSIGMNILLNGKTLGLNNEPDADTYINTDSLTGLSACYSIKWRAISAEISLTNLIHAASYKSNVLMTAASASKTYVNDSTVNDVLSPGTYYGIDVHPYETIFFKANREISRGVIDKLTRIHDRAGYNSWKACSRSIKSK